MKESTRKTLLALASTGSGEVAELPIAQDLYPPRSVRAAIEAFSPYCRVLEFLSVDSPSVTLSLSVLPEHRSESREIIGEFFNFLLADAVSRGPQSEGEG
jgi:hypothetical protein